MFLILLYSVLMFTVFAQEEDFLNQDLDEVIADHGQEIIQGLRVVSVDAIMEKKEDDENLAFSRQSEAKVSKASDINESDENIVDMNLDTVNNMIDEKNDAIIFSNVKDSGMETFDEDVLEEELKEADIRPGHTPWSLIGMVVGGGVLVVAVVGMSVAGGVVWKKKNKNKARGTDSVADQV